MCTVPRLVGLRLQTLAVMALKRQCSGWPKASGSGLHMELDVGMGLCRVAACEEHRAGWGAMLMGPLRLAYSRPMRLAQPVVGHGVGVGALRTLKTVRIWGDGLAGWRPPRQVLSYGDTQTLQMGGLPQSDNSSICGEPIDPAHAAPRHGRWRSPSGGRPKPAHRYSASRSRTASVPAWRPGRCSTVRSWGGHSKSRAQEGLGGVPAPAILLVDLEIAHAFVVATVEVITSRYTGLHGGLRKGVQHFQRKRCLSTRHSPPALWWRRILR